VKKRREINAFSISFLDLLSGALGAVIILYVAIPKNKSPVDLIQNELEKETIKRELTETKSKLEQSLQLVEKLKQEMATANNSKVEDNQSPVEENSNEENPTSGGPNLDVGFKFKGKNIVFMIDTSYSMHDEDRMGQVKAGLKMLLTSMPANFKIEIVQFPFGMRAPFRSLWGNTKDSKKINKIDAFDFLYRLHPAGATPTREAMIFVLKNYDEMSDLILLTDGVPTLHNSNKKDDIFDILRVVREVNKRKVQISTIGVGTNFLSDKTSDQYKFLSLLAEETGGFFVGF
jgi:hypothetical protein